MNGLTVVVCSMIIFACAYVFYGRWLVKTWGIDPDAKTPAYRFENGKDFAKTPQFSLCNRSFIDVWLGSGSAVESVAFSSELCKISPLFMLPLKTMASPWA
jgi:hypothetical protein